MQIANLRRGIICSCLFLRRDHTFLLKIGLPTRCDHRDSHFFIARVLMMLKGNRGQHWKVIYLRSKRDSGIALECHVSCHPQSHSCTSLYLKWAPQEYTSQKALVILTEEKLFLALPYRRRKKKKKKRNPGVENINKILRVNSVRL